MLGIERYELGECAGRGGMGDVFRAVDRRDGSTVAIKLLSRLDSNHVARFEREARALQSVQHEAIVRYLDFGEWEEGRPYLAVEWLGGTTLRDTLRERRFSLPIAGDIALQILRGLAAAHEANVLHRDVKPANILIDVTGEPRIKLVDFGLARSVDLNQAKLTRTGAVVGTPNYLAPELILGEPPGVTADIWAAALVMVELVTGRPVFAYGDLATTLQTVLVGDIWLPHRLSDTPFGALLRRALSRNPKDRFASASAMANVLSQSLADLPNITLSDEEIPPSEARASARALEASLGDGGDGLVLSRMPSPKVWYGEPTECDLDLDLVEPPRRVTERLEVDAATLHDDASERGGRVTVPLPATPEASPISHAPPAADEELSPTRRIEVPSADAPDPDPPAEPAPSRRGTKRRIAAATIVLLTCVAGATIAFGSSTHVEIESTDSAECEGRAVSARTLWRIFGRDVLPLKEERRCERR